VHEADILERRASVRHRPRPDGPIYAARPAERHCVIDPRLALHPLGAFIARRALEAWTVWLPHELCELLRAPNAVRRRPEELLPRVYGSSVRRLDRDRSRQDVLSAIEEWHPLEIDRAGFFHLEDSLDAARVPAGISPVLFERQQALASELELLSSTGDREFRGPALIRAAYVDTAALAAALLHHGGFVLSLLEPDGRGAPALCNYLDAWGVSTLDVGDRAILEAPALRHGLGAAGLEPCSWLGVQLAAVYVFSSRSGLASGSAFNGARAAWFPL
jgi:hypothetical protein